MENKLYYQDAYIDSFSAKMITQAEDELKRVYVVLDRTGFYPTGGGQPHDLGTINDINVLNVEEVDGEIRHYVEKKLSDTTGEVLGVVDWERRFDHMQQHAGQHILSAAFDQLFQYKTVSFHLGKDVLTIDLDTETITEQEALEAEKVANQIIIENRPIETKWVTEEELQQYDLRKDTKVKEDIRLVIIPDFDYNGCGGTHPRATGEVRAIKILDWERQKKKIRVQFVCGDRVLNHLHQKQKVLLELTKLLNTPEKEMDVAVRRLFEKGKELERLLEQDQEELMKYEAKDLLSETEGQSGNKMIKHIFQNRTIQELQKLARLIIAADETASVFFISENENRLQVVGARGTVGGLNMKKLIGEILPHFNGKGGGSDSIAQGGGETNLTGQQIMLLLEEKILNQL